MGGYLEANSLRSTNLFHLFTPEIQTEHVILDMLYIVMVISKKKTLTPFDDLKLFHWL